MKPAAEGQTAVLLVKWKGVHLQAAGQRHLHGPVVLHRAGGVDVDVGDRRGLPFVHAGITHEGAWRGKVRRRQQSGTWERLVSHM